MNAITHFFKNLSVVHSEIMHLFMWQRQSRRWQFSQTKNKFARKAMLIYGHGESLNHREWQGKKKNVFTFSSLHHMKVFFFPTVGLNSPIRTNLSIFSVYSESFTVIYWHLASEISKCILHIGPLILLVMSFMKCIMLSPPEKCRLTFAGCGQKKVQKQ